MTKEQVLVQAEFMKKNAYGQHLFNVINNKIKY